MFVKLAVVYYILLDRYLTEFYSNKMLLQYKDY